jgi:hypothetical protein
MTAVQVHDFGRWHSQLNLLKPLAIVGEWCLVGHWRQRCSVTPTRLPAVGRVSSQHRASVNPVRTTNDDINRCCGQDLDSGRRIRIFRSVSTTKQPAKLDMSSL